MRAKIGFWSLLVFWLGIMALPGLLLISLLLPYPSWYPTQDKACRIAAESIATYRRDHPGVMAAEELDRAGWAYSRNCPPGYPIPDLH